MTKFPFVLSLFLILLSGCPLGGGSGVEEGEGCGTSCGVGPTPGGKGSTAKTLLENPLSSVCESLGGVLYFGSNGGKLLYSTDGKTFKVLDAAKVDMSSAFCDRSSSATNVWFAGAGGAIVKFDGAALSSETTNTTTDLHSIFGFDASNIYATGDSALLLHFESATWTAESTGILGTIGLFGVGGPNSALVFIAGGLGTLLQRNNSTSFSQVTFPSGPATDTQMNAIYGDSLSSDIFVAGNAGVVLRKSGSTWAQTGASVTSSNLLSIHGTSTSNVYAVGASGTILRFDGSTWVKETNPEGTKFTLYGVLATGSTAFAVGADGTSATSEGVLLKRVSGIWKRFL